VLIRGYDYAALTPGEPLLEQAGFWSNHLLGMVAVGTTGPTPEWFGDDGADTEELSETLLDDLAWPVFRIPFNGDHTAVVVYRNLVGDYGIDFLLTRPDWARAQTVASFDGDWSGPGLSWRSLIRIADTPDLATRGLHAAAGRLLLLLPCLCGAELPVEAPARVAAALAAVGAPDDGAQDTAELLLSGRRAARHRGPGGSPLSGGRPDRETGADEHALLSTLAITEAEGRALAGALGVDPWS
jgi:hypothetical protein